MALTLARALDSKKGKNIRVLEINNVTTLADYFVLCTGTSAPQLKALADAGEKAMKEAGILPHHIEGHRGAPGSSRITATWWSTCSTPRPGPFTTWTVCGRTRWRWTSPTSSSPNPDPRNPQPLISRNRKCDQIEIRV